MNQVYWMGGAPCAGKTTISHIISQEFGWYVYHIDRHIESYLRRATADVHPALTTYKKMGLQKFLLQTSDIQFEQVVAMHHEQVAFIEADIAELRQEIETPILVEGANLIPDKIAQKQASPKHSIWLVPTEKFLLDTYPKRGNWVQEVLRRYEKADDGVQAFENWMMRDARFAGHIAHHVQAQSMTLITVDGSVSLLDNAEIAMRHFGLLN
ncbi:MAG: hypothetical protein AAFN11_12875 [Chloroflexota bacterium]